MATIGAPFDPAHVIETFAGSRETIAREGAADVTLGGRNVRIGQGFLTDVAEAKLDAAIAALDRALLILHAPRDEVVGIENATRIFLAARHRKAS